MGRAQRRSSVVYAHLARGPVHANLLEVLLLVEGHGRHLLSLAVGKRHDVIVEIRNRHPPLLVDQPGKYLGQSVGRIRDRAAKRAGVQIAPGPWTLSS